MRKNILSKYLIILTFITTLIFVSGCQDFLTEVNPNKQTTASFWKTLDDADQGLSAVYNRLKDASLYGTNLNNWSDLTFPGYGNRISTTNEFYLSTFTNSTTTVTSVWNALYSGIFRANQVIAGMKTVSYSSSLADQNRAKYILGQAYFFRGLFYFYLYNTYNVGSVPIKDLNNMYEMYTKLSPATDVRNFYLKDLETAYEMLPDNWRTSAPDQGRATKGAAASVLGQSYLYEKDYATAATYFLDVINNTKYGKINGYHLVPNIGDNFNVAGELNEESILEICFSKKYLQDKQGAAENGVATGLARNLAPDQRGGWRVIIPAAWLEFAFREEILDYSDERNMYPNGEFHTYSLRLAKSIACTQDTSSISYGKKPHLAYGFAAKETSYFKKFTNCETPGVTDEDKIYSQSGINFRVIRLADIYLMYAECMIKGGADDAGVTEALKYVNKVRQRSALQLLGDPGTGEFPLAQYDYLNYTAQTLMDFIKWKERPMELCIEGYAMRHIDLRRWGGVKERYTLLSQQAYWFKPFSYKSSTGSTVTLYNVTLVKLEPPLTTSFFNEFVQTALSYNPTYDYFPIPSGEETANPDLYK